MNECEFPTRSKVTTEKIADFHSWILDIIYKAFRQQGRKEPPKPETSQSHKPLDIAYTPTHAAENAAAKLWISLECYSLI